MATAEEPARPLLSLPRFLPDSLPFAARTTAVLLLAYLVAFAAQVTSASSAGVCVGLVAQPSAGMSLSKARYRMLGTLIGGFVALALVSAFPQNRTLLLREKEWEGRIFLSGPTDDVSGHSLNGLTIINAHSRKAAEALAAEDPLVKSGSVSYSLHIWHINDGKIALDVLLSDKSGSLNKRAAAYRMAARRGGVAASAASIPAWGGH
jgi:uncharacterized protein YciI